MPQPSTPSPVAFPKARISYCLIAYAAAILAGCGASSNGSPGGVSAREDGSGAASSSGNQDGAALTEDANPPGADDAGGMVMGDAALAADATSRDAGAPSSDAQATGSPDGTASAGPALKPRIVFMTDIVPPGRADNDDLETMIRFLAYQDRFQAEALIACQGANSNPYSPSYLSQLTDRVDAYEKDVPNLMKRSNQTGFMTDESKQPIGYWPSPAYLKARSVVGSLNPGVAVLGENNDSDGSNLIIKVVDADDPRPVWVVTGGGLNTLSQAIWRVQHDRTADQLKTFLHKVRAFAIIEQDIAIKNSQGNIDFSCQTNRQGTAQGCQICAGGGCANQRPSTCDASGLWQGSSHYWLRKNFGQNQALMVFWDECQNTWSETGEDGTHWPLYMKYIQNSSNLGKEYTTHDYGVEGDTQDILYVLPNGLHDPEIPTQPSWSGYFQWQISWDYETYAWTNQSESPTQAYATSLKYNTGYYMDAFNDFAARMDWAQDGKGNRNPVAVVNGDGSLNVLTMTPKAGTSITLDASKSTDPDGDPLTFKWTVEPEPGTYTGTVDIPNDTSSSITLSVPADSAGKTFHVVCQVTDNGAHTLVAYRRIIVAPTG